jgi:hypothetical protein
MQRAAGLLEMAEGHHAMSVLSLSKIVNDLDLALSQSAPKA